MHWSIEYLQRHDYVHVAVQGAFAPGDFDRLHKEIVRHRDWRPGLNILFDDTDLDTDNLYTADVEYIAELIAAMKSDYEQSKMAIVVGSDVQYGLARQLQALTESQTGTQMRVFVNEDEAANWLRTEPDKKPARPELG